MTDKYFVQIGNKKQEATGEVLQQILQDIQDSKAQQAEATAKAAARESALAKLVDLGLTEEEVAAL
jgi:DNA-binding NarL/FixJ family response regulator